jgi:MFS transporter, OPA family, solute carrier family 37 (glycerol-3-phosphate transporter), member 1/2
MTFVAYALSHFSRKAYTSVKMQLINKAMLGRVLLSDMDTAFMLSYAFGSFVSGNLADTMHAPTIIGLGLIGSGVSLLFLLVGVLRDIVSCGSLLYTYTYFLLLWATHGAFQSTGGPVHFKIVIPVRHHLQDSCRSEQL